MTRVKTLREMVDILVNHHPKFGDDWMSKSKMYSKLTERNASTDKDLIERGLNFLNEVGVAEKKKKERKNMNLPNTGNHHDVWRIKGEPEEIDLQEKLEY